MLVSRSYLSAVGIRRYTHTHISSHMNPSSLQRKAIFANFSLNNVHKFHTIFLYAAKMLVFSYTFCYTCANELYNYGRNYFPCFMFIYLYSFYTILYYYCFNIDPHCLADTAVGGICG